MMKASSSIAVAACLLLAVGGSVRQANSQAASPTLDYRFFKDKVQSVFLHKREGHTRCAACHTVNNDDAPGAAVARRYDLE
jgi:mono/diheme cytochrome c family protein